jgi:hypothetical protein
MTLYDDRKNAVRPVLQIAMPHLPRIYAPGGTMHVVARGNNREFYFAGLEDLEINTQKHSRERFLNFLPQDNFLY